MRPSEHVTGGADAVEPARLPCDSTDGSGAGIAVSTYVARRQATISLSPLVVWLGILIETDIHWQSALPRELHVVGVTLYRPARLPHQAR